MKTELQNQRIQHFVKHQSLWGCFMLISWFAINMLVLSTSTYMEHIRRGEPLPFWAPLCWELSSISVILLLIPVGIWINDRWLGQVSFKYWLGWNLLLSLPFSMTHVAAMVGIRKLCYWTLGENYIFGDLPREFLYEYNKDIQSYFTLALLIFGYRLLVRRLQGEASYLAQGDSENDEDDKDPDYLPERLLIKKLGREFLVPVNDIEWVEAAGNYANLYSKGAVYPMRITMDKLEKRLPSRFVRIHRSSIVNIDHIKEMQSLDSGDYEVTMHNGKRLSLSRRYREEFKAQLSFG